MHLITIKKPTRLNPKWTAIFEHLGKKSIYEFDSFENSCGFYIKAKHDCGERFLN